MKELYVLIAIVLLPQQNSEIIAADWSVFNVLSDVNVSESLDIVKKLPVHTYWDYEKGTYRTSIIGDLVMSDFPNLVKLSRKQLEGTDGVTRLVNVTVVDSPVVFMHAMVAIQYLANVAMEYNRTLSALLAEKYDFGLKVLRIANKTGTEWRTASEIRAVTAVVNLKILNKKTLLEIIKKQADITSSLLKMKYDGKRNMLDLHHDNMIRARAAQYGRYETLDIATQAEKRRLVRLAEEERATTQEQVLRAKQDEELAKIKLEMNMSLDALRFRYAEMGRMERDSEDLTIKLMEAKAENMRKSFEQIVTSLRGMFSQVVERCMTRPLDVLMAVGMILALMSTYIFCVELAKAMKVHILHLIFPHKTVRHAKKGIKSTQKKTLALEGLVLSPVCGESFFQLARIYTLCADSGKRGGNIPLPNVLLVGPPGTGKTMCAEAMAAASGLPYVILIGADILAASSNLSFGSSTGPGGILRDTLEAAVRANGGNGFIVILDEADAVIADRGKSRSERSPRAVKGVDQRSSSCHESGAVQTRPDSRSATDVAKSSVECIHILLHRLRVGSPALGVMITTSMNVGEVDPALLDRMDRVMTLDLPSAVSRLECVVKYMALLLSDHLDQSLVADVQILLLHFSNNKAALPSLDDCSERQFRVFLEKALEREFRRSDLSKSVQESLCAKSEKKAVEADDVPGAAPPPRRGRAKRGSAASFAKEEVKEKPEDTVAEDVPRGGTISADNESFDLCVCLYYFVRSSEGWSYREVEKVVQNMLLDVLSTEKCLLTSAIWIRQIEFKKSALEQATPRTTNKTSKKKTAT